jgi:hypothetical protein
MTRSCSAPDSPSPVSHSGHLDAIHLSTAMRHTFEVGATGMLSLNHQIRMNAQALGLAIVP